ncbi:MAG: GNAT family N-acetyltransferase [Verrucomicrobiota bacterium]
MIERFTDLPYSELEPLIEESRHDGFRFLATLRSEWSRGENRFNRNHEGFFGYRLKDELVAVGGLNEDPYSTNHRIGRLRRFYVKKSERRKGIGRTLVGHILNKAKNRFVWIRLRTDTLAASKFYESLGFLATEASTHATHELNLENSNVVAMLADRHRHR